MSFLDLTAFTLMVIPTDLGGMCCDPSAWETETGGWPQSEASLGYMVSSRTACSMRDAVSEHTHAHTHMFTFAHVHARVYSHTLTFTHSHTHRSSHTHTHTHSQEQ